MVNLNLKNKGLYIRKIDIIILSFLFFLILIFLYPLLTVSVKEQIAGDSWLVAVSFLPIIIVSIILIASEAFKGRLSLSLVHVIFILIFLGLAPLIQYLNNTLPFTDFNPIEDMDIVLANILIIAWMVFYILGYYSLRAGSRAFGSRFFNAIFRRQVGYKSFFLTLFLAAIALFWLWELGAFNLWTRVAYAGIYPDNHSLALIVKNFVRAIPVIVLATCVLFLIKGPKKPWLILSTALLVVLSIFLNNPLAAARYWTATILIGFVVIILLGKWKSPLEKLKLSTFLVFCIIIGLLIILPLINIGRYESSIREAVSTMKLVDPVKVLQTGHFDAYANFVHTIHYTKENGITWGRQLMGSLLFFVPRDVWSNKPVGSGHVVGEYFSFSNFNISSPLPAEAMINFGMVGIAIFALIFGKILRIIDDCFIKRIRRASSNFYSVEFIDVVYPFWLGFIFFVLRGDLMSSLAYMVGFTLAGLPLILIKNKNYENCN